jgi:RNA polymerase sigma-70 factor (ECF subfamily)
MFPKRFMNTPAPEPVFMFEGLRVATGQVTMLDAVALGQAEDPLDLAVREHARLVYRIAYSVLRNHHDAEDATQETFMRVLRYSRKLAGVRDRRTWLARIAWRVAVERRRNVSEIPLNDVSDAVERIRSSAVGADEMIFSAEMREFLGALIASLPAKLRAPLTLSTVEDMSPADIAGVLGINDAAVRSRLFRARQILREKLTVLLEGSHGT